MDLVGPLLHFLQSALLVDLGDDVEELKGGRGGGGGDLKVGLTFSMVKEIIISADLLPSVGRDSIVNVLGWWSQISIFCENTLKMASDKWEGRTYSKYRTRTRF